MKEVKCPNIVLRPDVEPCMDRWHVPIIAVNSPVLVYDANGNPHMIPCLNDPDCLHKVVIADLCLKCGRRQVTVKTDINL